MRALPKPAYILFGGAFINRFGSFVSIFLILYLRKLGYSIPQAGLVISTYGIGNVIASGLGGYMADRLGRRNTIAISMFSSAAAMMLLSQARGLPMIVAATILAGAATELYRPASSALLADLVPEDLRVTGFAVYRLAINAGFAFGPATAGFLADRSFFYVFLGDAITSCAFGIVALVALPEGVRTRKKDEAPGEGWGRVLKDRHLLVFCIATVCAAFGYMQVEAGLPLHAKDVGLSNTEYGALISLNGLLIVFLELPISQYTQRKPARPIIAIGLLFVGVGFGLTALAHTGPALAATVVVWTMGEMVNAPVAQAYIAGLAPPRLRGRYQGVWSFSFAFAFLVAPSGGTALYAWSPNALWITCAVLGAVAAALVMTLPERVVHPGDSVGAPGPELPGIPV